MGQATNIIEEIKKGKIAPVYLLHGDEAYLIENTITELIENLVPKSARDFNLDVFSTPDVSIDEIISIADTYPVMAERRVIVVKNPGFLGPKKEVDLFEVFLESRELYRIGNFSRSAGLMAKAFDLAPDDFAEGGSEFTKAFADFKTENEGKLSSDDLEFLEDNAQSLTTHIDVFSAPSSSSGLDWLLEWLKKQTSSNSVLIIAANSTLNVNNPLVKVVSQVGRVLSFGRLRQSSIIEKDPMYAIVREKLKEHKKTISPQAFTELRNKTGNDMGQIFDELNKIITFVGEKQQIEKSDVEDLVTKSDFEGIFDLTRAVSQRSLPLALATLKSIMKSTRKNDKEDNPPIKIHFMLTRQIRLLLQAKLLMENGHLKPLSSLSNYDSFQQQVFNKLSPQLINLLPESKQSNLLKQSPYPMYITIQQAKNFTVEELIKAMGRLLEADVQLKSGTLTPELVVEMLVVDLCSPSKK